MSNAQGGGSTIAVPCIPPRQASTLKIVVACSVGNALEWFDFVAYAMFATIIAKLFFPTGSDFSSLLATLGTFAVGFLMRSLGASSRHIGPMNTWNSPSSTPAMAFWTGDVGVCEGVVVFERFHRREHLELRGRFPVRVEGHRTAVRHAWKPLKEFLNRRPVSDILEPRLNGRAGTLSSAAYFWKPSPRKCETKPSTGAL